MVEEATKGCGLCDLCICWLWWAGPRGFWLFLLPPFLYGPPAQVLVAPAPKEPAACVVPSRLVLLVLLELYIMGWPWLIVLRCWGVPISDILARDPLIIWCFLSCSLRFWISFLSSSVCSYSTVFFFSNCFSLVVEDPPGLGEIDLPWSSIYLYSIFSFILTKVLTDMALVANRSVE